MDFRKISNISVDCVVFGFDNANINILLSNRKLKMHDLRYSDIDDWVLTGDHVFKSERLDESATRIFKGLTGLDDVYKKQFRTFGNPDRIKNEKDSLWLKSSGVDPRVMSVAYYFLLPSEIVDLRDENIKWFPIRELPQLGFDHHEIIACALEDLKQKVMSEPVIFEFLPDKFTLNELQLAYESVLNIEIDNRNFRKKAISKTYIVPLEEKRVGISKKPARLFMFSRDIYEKTCSRNHIINI
ncbi:NUDIX hydrolase [Ancylomarina sp. 16SWW S1-10-2]|uniref:NUDIX hydrolase n=1 Tax=Ancylomarina sp. 16SWW S1-10-2 TaxID=2499681 RepID=UPI0012AE64DF|nr:NUDIX hydrolase [Ancylomarina sp. 16SWW S1-10-2]MRT94502.1 NUDIX domain-containing protein [Ancylomarina sp. 16SWW S1-10-2]